MDNIINKSQNINCCSIFGGNDQVLPRYYLSKCNAYCLFLDSECYSDVE